jgi:hypothetical protein
MKKLIVYAGPVGGWMVWRLTGLVGLVLIAGLVWFNTALNRKGWQRGSRVLATTAAVVLTVIVYVVSAGLWYNATRAWHW